jgi:hypothetical protein
MGRNILPNIQSTVTIHQFIKDTGKEELQLEFAKA